MFSELWLCRHWCWFLHSHFFTHFTFLHVQCNALWDSSFHWCYDLKHVSLSIFLLFFLILTKNVVRIISLHTVQLVRYIFWMISHEESSQTSVLYSLTQSSSISIEWVTLRNLRWLLYVCEWASDWPPAIFWVCYVHFHAFDVSLKHSCSQSKCMAWFLWEAWGHYATEPLYCYSIRGNTFHMHHTFNGRNCMSLSPLCTSNEFPLRSGLASLQPLPEMFHRAEFISRQKICILQ